MWMKNSAKDIIFALTAHWYLIHIKACLSEKFQNIETIMRLIFDIS